MNELAIIPPDHWAAMQSQAQALVSSGFLPQGVNTPQKAVAIMMLGRELGIAPWASLTSINVIQGKPTVSPQLMLGLINRSGQIEDMVVESTDAGCKVTMKRKGRTPHTEEFTMQDAATLGLTTRDNWRKQPATMLKWRAVAACARVVFADVILGLYTPDEMGADVATDDQGNMTVLSVPAPTRAQPQRQVSVDTGEVVEGTVVTPEPEPPTPHIVPKPESNPLDDFGLESANAGQPVPPVVSTPWIKSTVERKRFIDWAMATYTMSIPSVLAALDVKTITDYKGTLEEARAACDTYSQQQKKATG